MKIDNMKTAKGLPMTKEQLKSRLVRINASKRIEIANSKKVARRDLPTIEVEDESTKVNDFFEFDKELSQLESASNLASRYNDSIEVKDEHINKTEVLVQNNVVENTIQELIIDIDSSDVLVEEVKNIEEPSATIIDIQVEQNESDLKVCEYVKEDGTRCKRQAPKKSIYCSAHRKQIIKSDK